jgi:hypothetical protein
MIHTPKSTLPHWPWSLIGVTAPLVVKSTVDESPFEKALLGHGRPELVVGEVDELIDTEPRSRADRTVVLHRQMQP